MILKWQLHGFRYIFTGTSSIPLSVLSESFPHAIAKHFCGIHFSNPPYNMTMGELIKSDKTDPQFFDDTCGYVKNILKRDVFIAKDEYGFIANRIAFRFLNEALQSVVYQYPNQGIDYIDAIFSGFTGRILPPLRTVDMVQLKTYKIILDNIYCNKRGDFFIEDYKMPSEITSLINFYEKDGKAFSLYKKEGQSYQVFDIKTGSYREQKDYSFDWIKKINSLLHEGYYKEAREYFLHLNIGETKFCRRLLVKYIAHALLVSSSENVNLTSIDCAIASGFNWCPPLALLDYFGRNNFQRLLDEFLIPINAESLLKEVPTSKYNFKRYIRAV